MRRVFFLALCLGCGDDGNTLGSSGVDGDARIIDLQEADLKRLCTWISDGEYARDAELECTANAVQAVWEGELDAAGCENGQRECVTRFRSNKETRRADELMRCREQTLSKPREGCTSTVAELERCHRDTLSKHNDFARQFSCLAIERAVPMPDYYPPSSCEDVRLSCFPVGGLEDR
ncbi:MAG: hypothetical protein ABW352_16775 [Polyangiales bacterium]